MNQSSSPYSAPYSAGVYHNGKTIKRPRYRFTSARVKPFQKATLCIVFFVVFACSFTFKAGWGINLPIVFGACLGLGFWRKPSALKHRLVWIQLCVWVALALATVLHFNPWTVTPFILASVVVLGSVWLGGDTDPMRAMSRFFVQLFYWPLLYLKSVRVGYGSLVANNPSSSKFLGLVALPSVVALGFAVLYIWSNSTLSAITLNFLDDLFSGSWFFDGFLLFWTAFFWSIIGAGLFYLNKSKDSVIRKQIGGSVVQVKSSSTNWSSVSVTLLLVNICAFILNIVDGSTTWFGEISQSGWELKRGVHAGTHTLIGAVVLASIYLIYHFRKSIEDYGRARVLGILWLVQNLMMVFTVALRNYHYTDAYGLTVKRIGVWLFLCCTATGLYFLGNRVQWNTSIEQLIRKQSWAVYLILAMAALPNWPGLITRYNFQDSRLMLDQAYLRQLLPYNLDVWAEHDPEVFRKIDDISKYRRRHWTAPISDWRSWEYRQMRRSILFEAYSFRSPVLGIKEDIKSEK